MAPIEKCILHGHLEPPDGAASRIVDWLATCGSEDVRCRDQRGMTLQRIFDFIKIQAK
jgi:hypothetical protein